MMNARHEAQMLDHMAALAAALTSNPRVDTFFETRDTNHPLVDLSQQERRPLLTHQAQHSLDSSARPARVQLRN